jgi:hypothetical protein
MTILENWLKSFQQPEAIGAADLKKALSDSENNTERLLQAADTIMGTLQKGSVQPNQATADAKNEAKDQKPATVESSEEVLESTATKKVKAAQSSVSGQATADAKDESEDQTPKKVFSSEEIIGEAAPTGKKVPINLRKSKDEMEEDKEKGEGEEEDELSEKDKDKAGEEILKSVRLADSEIRAFDVTTPLTNLRKGFDEVVARQVVMQKKQDQFNANVIGLLKSLVDSTATNFTLQKAIASELDKQGAEPLRPKGQVLPLRKSFPENTENVDAGTVTPRVIVDTLQKGLEAGKFEVSEFGRVSDTIATIEMTQKVTPVAMNLYNMAIK